MKANMGSVDRTLRILIGVVVIVLGFVYQSWWGLVGFVPLITGLVGYCGLYSLIGVSTCKLKDKPAQS
ncbi:MAG: DUF2892 domain-containing protein [Candidatus Zixiibacteriota bacterium]|nr:MAG: DUF2892 domain-containing protein [candidate division Zixibacteria bacterium]